MGAVMDAFKNLALQKEQINIDKENQKVNGQLLKEAQSFNPQLLSMTDAIGEISASQLVLSEAQLEASNTMLVALGNNIPALMDSLIVDIEDMTSEEAAANESLLNTMNVQLDQMALSYEEDKKTSTALVATNETLKTEITEQQKANTQLAALTKGIDEIAKSNKDAAKQDKKEALASQTVKGAPKAKEAIASKKGGKSKGGFDMKMFMGGFMKVLKTFLNPVTWIVGIVAEFLPWILIFGAVLLGFLKKAGVKGLLKLVGLAIKYLVIPFLAIKGVIAVIKKIATAIGEQFKKLGQYIWKQFKSLLNYLWGQLKKFGSYLWKQVSGYAKKFYADHLKEHVDRMKTIIKERIDKMKEHLETMRNAIRNKFNSIREHVVEMKNKAFAHMSTKKSLSMNMKIFAINIKNMKKEMALKMKQWKKQIKDYVAEKRRKIVEHKTAMAVSKTERVNAAIEHRTEMTQKNSGFMMKLKEHVTNIGHSLKEFAMSVGRHLMELGRIIKDVAMSVIKFARDLARIIFEIACAVATFIKEMIPIVLKIIQAIAVFIADLARVVIQIAMAAGGWLLMALAAVAIIALIAGVIIVVVKVIAEIWPVIAEFLSFVWDMFVDTIFTFFAFMGNITISIFECIGSFLGAIMNPFKWIWDIIKEIFAADDDDEKDSSSNTPATTDGGIENLSQDYFTSFFDDVRKALTTITKVVTDISTKTTSPSIFGGATNQQQNSVGIAELKVANVTVSDSVKVQNNNESSSFSGVGGLGAQAAPEFPDHNDEWKKLLKILEGIEKKLAPLY